MNRNQLLLISIAGASLLAIAAAQMVWSKGHVPSNMSQVCHGGLALNVARPALGSHLRHGDCQLSVCDFANNLMPGALCTIAMGTEGGFCDLPNTPNRADGISPACSVPF